MNRGRRLRGRARFAAVRSAGAEARHGVIRVRALGTGRPLSRAGFAVPGAPSAVTRNRLRRRLRAAITPLLAGHPGFDIVVSAPVTAPETAFADLRRSLTAALERATVRAAAR